MKGRGKEEKIGRRDERKERGREVGRISGREERKRRRG